ncbi:hypothetical protein [Paraburkholderia sp. SUR17]|uniref:hypothetical protein n=1 Tax=Paraburkholderia sp. SUR17 TaxID=3034358 RepID=UPI002407CD7E|nr:hypothetical protein [Paraburkholderia sp. SUR17]WEY42818.1 hypothetical protein P2869_22720 [Paraburkholderia sp. SUR17]
MTTIGNWLKNHLLPSAPQQPTPATPNEPAAVKPVAQTRPAGTQLEPLRALNQAVRGQPAQPDEKAVMRTDLKGDVGRKFRPGTRSLPVLPGYTKNAVDAMPAQPDVQLHKRQVRTPDPKATAPAAVERLRNKDVKRVTGKTDRTRSQASFELNHAGPAAQRIASGFTLGTHPTARDERAALGEKIRDAIPADKRGEPPHTLALMLGRALAEVSGGDVGRANTLLDQLRDSSVPRSDDERRDLFALTCALSRAPLSFEALSIVAPHELTQLQSSSFSKTENKIHNDANRETRRAADKLLKHWPPNEPRPRDIGEMLVAANTVLPRADRHPGLASDAPDTVAKALGSEPLAAKALICGAALIDDPRANPETRFRSAYLAFRNHISEEKLGQVQSRMYHMVTQAQRTAQNAQTGSWLRRAANFMKSPRRMAQAAQHTVGTNNSAHDALNLGTAGGLLQHPEDDFSTVLSIDVVMKQLNNRIVAAPVTPYGQQPDPQLVQNAVRAVALGQWQQAIGAKGKLRRGIGFGRTQRGIIEREVAKMLHVDRKTVRESQAFKDLPRQMTADELATWAEESGAAMDDVVPDTRDRTLRQNIERMKVVLYEPDPQASSSVEGIGDSLCYVIGNMPRTWQMQLSSGGVYGVNANISDNLATALGIVGLPAAAIAPDVALLRGRHSVVEVGSSAHNGQLFIGTDKRVSMHAGMGGFIGWSLLGGRLMASGYGSAVAGRDTSKPRGVMFRARVRSTEDPAGEPEAWRDKLQSVVRNIYRSGPGAQAPRSQTEMWDGLAEEFYKDPDLSINWLENNSATNYVSVSGTAGARYVNPDGYKFGPYATAEGRVSGNTMHREDATGMQTVETAVKGRTAGVNGSASLVAAPAPSPYSTGSPFGSSSLPSTPAFGIGVSVLQSATGAALRIAEEDGNVVPERTFRDTEFTNVDHYLQYIDSRNADWSASAEHGQQQVNEYLTKVKLNSGHGNQIHGERQRMTPEAGAEINAYRNVLRLYDESGRPHSDEDKKEIARIQGEMARVLESPASWTNQVLYTYEINVKQQVKGPMYVIGAQSVKQVSAEREVSTLTARNS